MPLGPDSTRHTTLSLLKRAKMHIKVSRVPHCGPTALGRDPGARGRAVGRPAGAPRGPAVSGG